MLEYSYCEILKNAYGLSVYVYFSQGVFMKQTIQKTMSYLLFFISILLFFSTNWFLATFDQLSLDEIVFHLKVPLKGSNSDFLMSFITGPLASSIMILIVISLIFLFTKRLFKHFNFKFKTDETTY